METQREASPNDQLLPPLEHVLSTLESDGSRRWLTPKLATGTWWNRRRIVAYVLMVVFVAIPHLRINGKPLILLDIAGLEFTILGKVFLPTDTLVLAFLMLTVFVGIALITAVAGRAWCGWACPQTVYMEFLFRPIDRFFHGTAGKGGRPKKDIPIIWEVARIAVYVALSMFLAHTFLSYFVSTEKLATWITSSPFKHPVAFLVMAVTTGAMLFDFLFFREQMCLIACPYGRFQSVMLDPQSLIVTYDHVRGEPRAKGKRIESPSDRLGDCVDCNQCVVVCPTGIDIRKGLQMECVNCTQCMDACDSVMAKVGKPLGLIRYSSQDAIEKKPRRFLRLRTILYPLVMLATLTGFALTIANKSTVDARIIRGQGVPFSVEAATGVLNRFSLRLVNRTSEHQSYQIELIEPSSGSLTLINGESIEVDPGKNVLIPLSIQFPISLTSGAGRRTAQLNVIDSSGNKRIVEFSLLGPR